MDYEILEDKIGYSFRDKALLQTALTHSSAAGEKGCESNQRLEFLGDAVLQLCVSYYIFNTLKKDDEGDLSKIRSLIVCADSLSVTAEEINLNDFIILGKGEEMSGGRYKKNILADAFESLLGAVDLDGGFDAASKVILKTHKKVIQAAVKGALKYDFKTVLQEYVQSRSLGELKYVLCGTQGPEHNLTFICAAELNGKVYKEAAGHNRKEAEQKAARSALETLGYFDWENKE